MTINISSAQTGRSLPLNNSTQHDDRRKEILSPAARLFNYKSSRARTLRYTAQSLALTKASLYDSLVAINTAMDFKQWRDVSKFDSAAIDYYDVFFNA